MRREELYLADLVDNARAVREYLDGVSRERWDADRVLGDAVLYRLLLLEEHGIAIIRTEFPELARAYQAEPETEDDPEAEPAPGE
jgi:uncharacterized protein with HEPN domain